MKSHNENALDAVILISINISIGISLLILFNALAMSTMFQILFAQSNYTTSYNSPGVYTNASKPYGLTYGDWTSKWWQWAYSVPRNVNPSYDDSGRYCSEGQTGPVWFLTGSYKHAVDRHCNIPAGKPILLPILNSECSFAEFPNLKTEQDLRTCAKQMQDSVIGVNAILDGVGVKGLDKYRIQSPLFNYTLGKDNILGLPAQTTTESVSDGNWLFLKLLPVGEHILYFKGSLKSINATSNSNTSGTKGNITFTGPYGWDSPVTYHLTITKP
jgi:hypothetical protein